MSDSSQGMEDRLNEIGVLKRREIEARIVGRLLNAFGEAFGEDKTRALARRVVIEIAEEQGQTLAEQVGGNSLTDFSETLEPWTRDGALELEVLESSPQAFSFNVTRCRYAEMYQQLGIPELGALLSCNRDYALCGGFNPGIKLTRTQTIMQGATHCDFRFQLEKTEQ